MHQNITIDKNSKLYQKFIQARQKKTEQSQSLAQKYGQVPKSSQLIAMASTINDSQSHQKQRSKTCYHKDQQSESDQNRNCLNKDSMRNRGKPGDHIECLKPGAGVNNRNDNLGLDYILKKAIRKAKLECLQMKSTSRLQLEQQDSLDQITKQKHTQPNQQDTDHEVNSFSMVILPQKIKHLGQMLAQKHEQDYKQRSGQDYKQRSGQDYKQRSGQDYKQQPKIGPQFDKENRKIILNQFNQKTCDQSKAAAISEYLQKVSQGSPQSHLSLRVHMQKLKEQAAEFKEQAVRCTKQTAGLINQVARLSRQVSELSNKIAKLNTQNKQLHASLDSSQSQVKNIQKLMQQQDCRVYKIFEQVKFYKQERHFLNIKIQDLENQLKAQTRIVATLVSSKQSLQTQFQERLRQMEELNKELSSVRSENSTAKQYLYSLTLKLYHSEQQLQKYRQYKQNDMLPQKPYKHNEMLPQHNKSQIPSKAAIEDHVQSNVYPNEENKTTRRRDFSKQRQARPTNKQQPRQQTVQHKAIRLQQVQMKKSESQMKQAADKVGCPKTYEGSWLNRQGRCLQIEKLLGEIEYSKVVTGKIRRQKMELERQLQQLRSS